MTCEACERDDGHYSMDRRCCRVRYLLNEPRIEVRRAWLERWEKRVGATEADAIKEEFGAAFEVKKNKQENANEKEI